MRDSPFLQSSGLKINKTKLCEVNYSKLKVKIAQLQNIWQSLCLCKGWHSWDQLAYVWKKCWDKFPLAAPNEKQKRTEYGTTTQHVKGSKISCGGHQTLIIAKLVMSLSLQSLKLIVNSNIVMDHVFYIHQRWICNKKSEVLYIEMNKTYLTNVQHWAIPTRPRCVSCTAKSCSVVLLITVVPLGECLLRYSTMTASFFPVVLQVAPGQAPILLSPPTFHCEWLIHI